MESEEDNKRSLLRWERLRDEILEAVALFLLCFRIRNVRGLRSREKNSVLMDAATRERERKGLAISSSFVGARNSCASPLWSRRDESVRLLETILEGASHVTYLGCATRTRFLLMILKVGHVQQGFHWLIRYNVTDALAVIGGGTVSHKGQLQLMRDERSK